MHQTRKALLASLLIGVVVAFGFTLAGIPNVELMTLTIFVSGFLLGARLGAIVGGASAALHSIFNPLGAALPPLLIAQVIGFAVTGLAGSLLGPVLVRMSHRWMAVGFSTVLGFLLTLTYHLFTSVGGFLSFTSERSVSGFVKYFYAGVPFVGMHLVWNTALFLMILVPVLTVLDKHREELSTG